MGEESEGTRRVLVTGATGFVGRSLVPLLLERGYEVHALVRESSDRGPLDGLPVRWHPGSLEDGPSIAAAVDAVGARASVIHAAALISYRRADLARSREVNVEGTRRVLEAARRASVARLLFVSSVVAVGHAAGPDDALDEDAPFNGGELGCAYVDTKREAEELVLAARGELDVVVAGPGAVFGPGSLGSNTTTLVREAAGGRLGPVAPPGSLSVVGVGCVAEGIRLALERGERGRRYLLTESNLTLRDLFERIARAVGKRPPRWILPPLAWRAVVAGSGLVDRVSPRERVTPQALALLGAHFRFDASRARRELGWRPRGFDEVLADLVAWLREVGG